MGSVSSLSANKLLKDSSSVLSHNPHTIFSIIITLVPFNIYKKDLTFEKLFLNQLKNKIKSLFISNSYLKLIFISIG